MTRTLRLYGCSIVFAIGAVCAAAGVRSDLALVVFLAAAAVTFVVAELERSRRRGERRR